MLLDALPEGGAEPLVMIVPRHPQRFDEVAGLAASALPTVLRRSTFGGAPPAGAAAADAWIGDSLGEMALYYALADVALLGGSFAPLGGQNLIEAAACGCPVLMGPHTFNVAAAADDSIAAGAALRAADLADAVARAVALATAPERGSMADAALAFARAHSGAAERMALEVVALLVEQRERAAGRSGPMPHEEGR